jgi:apolipoprotein N-acyltransferase
MAFPSVFSAIIEWIAFIPAALVFYSAIEDRINLKDAYWGSFWLIYSQNVIVYHWFISFYPLEFTGMSKLAAAGVVIVAIFGLALLAAIFGGLLGLIAVLVSRARVTKRFPILLPIVAASAYVLGEWIRTKFWFGVPWGRLPLGQLTDGVPLTVLSASIFGQYFVTFLIVIVSFLIAQGLYLERIKLRSIIAVSLAVVNLLIGIIVYYIPNQPEDTICVAAIQGNISSRDKWDPTVSSLKIHLDLTRDAAIEGADLIVWSETSVMTLDNRTLSLISDICREYETNVLFGCFDYDDDNSPMNILRLVDSNGKLADTVYVKRHLVPFGEYVPMRRFVEFIFPPLAEIGMLSEDLLEGENSELFTIRHNGKDVNLGGLICFDSIYEELSYQTASDGADILCVSTNDSWFEDSRAVYMHCAQSRLRAIETGLSVVRAANTGISATITKDGVVTETLDPLLRGYVISDIDLSTPSANSSIGNAIVLILCFLSLAVLPIIEAIELLRKGRK